MSLTIDQIRDMMPGVIDTTYLNTGTCGPLPKIAYDAMVEELGNDLTRARINSEHFYRLFELWGEARSEVAAVLHTDASNIAITNRTTDGMYVALMGYPWQDRDELIITNIEHPGGLIPSFLARQRFNIRVKVADVKLGGQSVEETVAAFEKQITPRTRMIALSHVPYTTGARLPVKEIVEMAHAHDVLVTVDAAQSYGAFDIDVHDLDVDFYACPGQKWFCGPDGTGALYVKPECLGEINQNFAGMLEFTSLDYHGRTYQPAPDASRFDTGGWSMVLLAGQIASTRWIREEVGLDWAYERIDRLGGAAYDALAEMDGVTMVTPRDNRAGLLAFTFDGVEPPDLTERLAEDHNVTIRYVNKYINNPDAARVSVGFYNNEEDIEKLMTGLEAVRSNLPEDADS
ncbi:MAG: aminotransferase class V-fold PLP-dependent enzyme [Thermomicrobiales bacterium]